MDVQFFNSGDHTPRPKEEVKIEAVSATPYPDGFRVLVKVQVTPFLERPNLMILLHDEDDQLVSELEIIETMHFDMEFTVHIRGKDTPDGSYALTIELFYETRNPPQDKVVDGVVISGDRA